MDYYESAKEEHQLAPSYFQPRDDASDFHRQKEAIMKILQTRGTVLNENDEVSKLIACLKFGLNQ